MSLSRRALLGSIGAALPSASYAACDTSRWRRILDSMVPEAHACGVTSPAPASALGFNRLLFTDDFTSTGTVAPDNTPTSGYNWYLAANATSANTTVHATTAASQINNGNTGGGSFPSANGGILTLNGPNSPGNGNVTIFTIPVSLQKGSDPGYGCWGPNVYMEVYAQYNPVTCAATPPNNQWFAPLWFFSQVLSGVSHNQGQEIDVVENFCGNFGFNANNSYFASHEWVGSTNTSNGGGSWGKITNGVWSQISMDANWHAYGFSWVSTSSTTGTVQPFFDNQPAVIFNNSAGTNYSTSQLSVGTGGTVGFEYLLTGNPLMAIMGGPPGFDMNIDYFRVWSA